MNVGDLRATLGLDETVPLTPDQRSDLARHIARQMLEILGGDDLAANALAKLIEAEGEADTARARNKIEGAKVMANLSLRDAIKEATATLKEVANRSIESSQELTGKLREVA